MASQIVDVISLKHEANFKFLYVVSVFNIDTSNLEVVCTEVTVSSTDIYIKYKLVAQGALAARYENSTRLVYISGVDWPNVPANHKTTVELFDTDGATSRGSSSMDTKDSPILR